MNKVQVSVVMAVHNSDIAFLKQSVNSILNQTYQNFELIIIDDINSYEVTNYLIEEAEEKNEESKRDMEPQNIEMVEDEDLKLAVIFM